ncbi:MAG: regulator of sigma E protease [Janthinobacterium sp.]|jgi:regulator of sigma E protease
MSMLHGLQTLLAFFVALGILIVIHELGHYTVARWCGVKVLRFSVGMGKVIYSRRFGPDQTEWAISVLPLGGYVKMLDAREHDVGALPPEDMAREFTRQNVWRRIAIVAAGPMANFLLAILLFSGLYMHGVKEPVSKVAAPASSSAAFVAGLRGGDLIASVNGEPTLVWSDLRWQVINAAMQQRAARFEVQRADNNAGAGDSVDGSAGASSGARFSVTLPAASLANLDFDGDVLGKLGIALARPKPVLGNLAEGGAAARAGLRSGDLITAIDGKAVADGIAFIDIVRASAGKTLMVGVVRAGQSLLLPVTPQADAGGIGKIMAEVALMPEMVALGATPVAALVKASNKVWDTSVMTLKMIGKMVQGELSWKNVTGPITIADYAGQTARIGVVSYLSFIAFISISLGVMNLLPVPVLDGGLLLYYSVEVLTGRPVPERFIAVAQRLGIGLLVTIMMLAVFNDVARLVS